MIAHCDESMPKGTTQVGHLVQSGGGGGAGALHSRYERTVLSDQEFQEHKEEQQMMLSGLGDLKDPHISNCFLINSMLEILSSAMTLN